MGYENIDDINPKLDALLDCGTNIMLINNNLKHLMTNYKDGREILILADNSHINISGRCSLGNFNSVAVITSLVTSLISTKVLCYSPFFYIIIHIDGIAYIIDRFINPQSGRAVIGTASIRSDDLYHMDNILDVIDYDYKGVDRSTDYSSILVGLYGRIDNIASNGVVMADVDRINDEHKELQRQHLQGSCQNKNSSCEVGMDPMTIAHVKYAHMSPKVILWASKYNTTKGMRFCYDQLKRTKLKLCDA